MNKVKEPLNSFHFDPTEFKNLRTGEILQGYVAYDELNQVCVKVSDIPTDDLQFLRRIVFQSGDGIVNCLIADMINDEQGCWVGNKFYDWKQIEPLLAEPNPNDPFSFFR